MGDSDIKTNQLEEEKFYPDLFERDNATTRIKEINGSEVIPQHSLYEATVTPLQREDTRFVTIFGFSIQNRKNILSKVNHTVNVSKIEEGKNYMNLWCDNITDLEKLLTFNHSIFNGEIIGAYRNNFGVIFDKTIYTKSKPIFRRILDYFF